MKGELGKEINLKVKLTSRYFGNKKEGLVKSQYLTLYAETKYYQEAGECIGEALEDGIILRKWGNIKLLPTKPTLHDKYNKEKFFKYFKSIMRPFEILRELQSEMSGWEIMSYQTTTHF